MDFGQLVFGSPPPPPPPPMPTPAEEAISATPGNTSNLDCWGIGVPCPLTRAVTLNADFTETGTVAISANELVELQKIDVIRGLYVYNDTPFVIGGDVSRIAMKFAIPAYSFGFVPLLVPPKETIRLFADPAIGVLKVIAVNVVMPFEFNPIG